MNASDLEPADRDPKAIRRTVIMLFLLIVVGGSMIFYKYQQQRVRDSEEVVAGRSARSSRLTRNFAGVCQDGDSRGLHDLEGKVWAVAPIVPNHPEENKIQLAKMKELAEIYKGNDNFHLVCISVADPSKHGYEELDAIAKEVGADINQWWFMAAEEESVIGFLKDHLKMKHINEREGADAEKFGKLDIPSQIKIIDQSRRVRGKPRHFDFDEALLKEKEVRDAIAKDPEYRSKLDSVGQGWFDFYVNMDETWTKRMHKEINYMFTETEPDSDPDYITAIMVTLCIVAFIVIQIVRIRRRKNA